MQALPEGFQLSPGIVIVKPLERSVNLHPTDVVASHTLILPKASRLIQSIKCHGHDILRLTRRKRESLANINAIGNGYGNGVSNRGLASGVSAYTMSSVGLQSTDGSVGVGESGFIDPASLLPQHTQLPVPLELDSEAEAGRQLLAAVSGFSSAMTAHLQMYVGITNYELAFSWHILLIPFCTLFKPAWSLMLIMMIFLRPIIGYRPLVG
jgi:hypothetical protein